VKCASCDHPGKARTATGSGVTLKDDSQKMSPAQMSTGSQ